MDPVPAVDPAATFERLQLDETSWVDVARGWLQGADEVFDALLHGVAWRQVQLFRYDHHVDERRLSAGWSWGRPLPHPVLADATRAIQHRYGVQFTSFAMMQYRDGRDGQAFHRDTDMRWLDDTIIAILTLGARRPWLLRPRANRHRDLPGNGATHDLAPGSGDLVVMGGRAQADWEHSVAYLHASAVGSGVAGPRISVQWRYARRIGRPFMGARSRAPLRFTG